MASVLVPNQSSQILPKEFKDRIIDMDGSYPLLLIEKSLKENDISHESDRLLLPLCKINGIFLTLEELRLLGSSKNNDIRVVLLDPSLSECVLRLKRRRSGSYELTGEWSSIVWRNGLKVGSKVQIWGFRVESRLCFGLVIV